MLNYSYYTIYMLQDNLGCILVFKHRVTSQQPEAGARTTQPAAH